MYDVDDPAWHLPPPRKGRHGGWGLIAPQVYGGEPGPMLPVMDGAACAGADPEMFFNSANKLNLIAAIRICRRCPIREQCLAEAMKPSEIDGRTVYPAGVWGGTTETQRALMRRGNYEPDQLPNYEPEQLPTRTLVQRTPPKAVFVESAPTPVSTGYDRILKALRRGAIVLDRGDDPPLILPASATHIAERLESQGCKRISLQDMGVAQ